MMEPDETQNLTCCRKRKSCMCDRTDPDHFFHGTCLREQREATHELGYQLMKRIAQVVIQNLNATQQRLLKCTDSIPKVAPDRRFSGDTQRNYGQRGN